MATINYNWTIMGLGCKQSDELGLIVKNVYYSCQGMSTSELNYQNNWEWTVAGTATLPDPNQITFIAFQNLSQEEVVSWIKNLLGLETVSAITTIIQKSIESQHQAHMNTVEWQSLPWEQK